MQARLRLPLWYACGALAGQHPRGIEGPDEEPLPQRLVARWRWLRRDSAGMEISQQVGAALPALAHHDLSRLVFAFRNFL